jgi:hypothetical protein
MLKVKANLLYKVRTVVSFSFYSLSLNSKSCLGLKLDLNKTFEAVDIVRVLVDVWPVRRKLYKEARAMQGEVMGTKGIVLYIFSLPNRVSCSLSNIYVNGSRIWPKFERSGIIHRILIMPNISDNILVSDLRFWHRWLWTFLSSGIWRFIVRWKSTNVSEEHVAKE